MSNDKSPWPYAQSPGVFKSPVLTDWEAALLRDCVETEMQTVIDALAGNAAPSGADKESLRYRFCALHALARKLRGE